jgi:hypothetical protein
VLGGTAPLVIGQFATVKLDFQQFAECCPLVQWDESEMLSAMPALEDDALVCHQADSDPILS